MSRRILLRLSYEGTAYAGWQAQDNALAVPPVLERASFGITGEIASRIMPDVFYDLDAPIQGMCTADVPLPFSPALEFPLIPDEKDIAAKIREMV